VRRLRRWQGLTLSIAGFQSSSVLIHDGALANAGETIMLPAFE